MPQRGGASGSEGLGRYSLNSHPNVKVRLRVTYDKTVDAAYIYLADSIGAGEVAHTEPGGFEHAHGVNLDFDTAGRLLGIEVLDASERLPDGFLQRFGN